MSLSYWDVEIKEMSDDGVKKVKNIIESYSVMFESYESYDAPNPKYKPDYDNLA